MWVFAHMNIITSAIDLLDLPACVHVVSIILIVCSSTAMVTV